MKYQLDSREDWLNAAIEEMRPMFQVRGYKLPAHIRVSVGFPGGGKRQSSYVNQCWAVVNGKDGAHELFISPLLDDEVKVLGALAHNLIHAAVGVKSGHRAPFQQCAAAMGLEAPWTATHEGSAFKAGIARPVLAALKIHYPHARLSLADVNSGPKKQSTRLLKCSCPRCGYTVRTTSKWINTSGAPRCPTPACRNKSMECETS
jgi:hypothetical protein